MGSSGIILNALRTLFGAIDNIAYWLFTQVYNLMFEIANTSLFSTTDAGSVAGEFGTRIYTILGVIMLFKMAISVIGYIIDPDKLDNQDKGFGGLIKNVVITIGLILAVPLIFRYAMRLQYAILEDDTISRIITGVKHVDGSTYDESTGKSVAFGLASGLISPHDGLTGCNNADTTIVKDECVNAINTAATGEGDDYKKAVEEQSVSALIKLATTNTTVLVNNDEDYLFDYHFIISTIVGFGAAYILLLFCIDIAVRSIKLVFFQMIAPIAIVSYLDEKGRNGVFKKWVSSCTSTYLDLFIRLAGIDLSIYIIENYVLNGKMTVISYKNGIQQTASPGLLTRVFIILGVLLFAKQLPKLIEDITGIKLSGGLQLNPFKKAEEIPFVGKKISSGMALAGRSAKNLGLAVGGLAGGLAVGTGKVIGDQIGNAYDGSDLQKSINAVKDKSSQAWDNSKIKGIADKAGGFASNVGGLIGSNPNIMRMGSDISSAFGGISRKKDESRIKEIGKYTSAADGVKSRLHDMLLQNKAGAYSDTYNRLQAELKQEQNIAVPSNLSEAETKKFKEDQINRIMDIQSKINNVEYGDGFTDMANDIITNGVGGKHDNEVDGKIKDSIEAARAAGIAPSTDYGTIKKESDKLKKESSDLTRKMMNQQEAKSK